MAPEIQSVVTVLKEGGSMVILGGLLYVIAMKALPSFLRALQDQRVQFLTALRERDDDLTKTLTRLESNNTQMWHSLRDEASERAKAIRAETRLAVESSHETANALRAMTLAIEENTKQTQRLSRAIRVESPDDD